MPSEQVNQGTRAEWRTLGFFYDRDDTAREWRIVGTVEGLQRLSRLIREYVANPANDSLSEHEHYGPYWYLEIGTWNKPEITDHWIAGPLEDLHRLSILIERVVGKASVGDRILLRTHFAPQSPYELVLEVREEDFDPASADPYCWETDT